MKTIRLSDGLVCSNVSDMNKAGGGHFQNYWGPVPPGDYDVEAISGRRRGFRTEPDPKSGLVDAERACMDHLLKAHEAFLSLQRNRPDEQRDWVDGMHRLQDLLANRVLHRLYPEFWA